MCVGAGRAYNWALWRIAGNWRRGGRSKRPGSGPQPAGPVRSTSQLAAGEAICCYNNDTTGSHSPLSGALSSAQSSVVAEWTQDSIRPPSPRSKKVIRTRISWETSACPFLSWFPTSVSLIIDIKMVRYFRPGGWTPDWHELGLIHLLEMPAELFNSFLKWSSGFSGSPL